MRIALVTSGFPPEQLGGTERVVEAQARELLRLGHEVLVVCGSEDASGGYRPRAEQQAGLTVLRIAKTRVERGQAHWRFARLTRVVGEQVASCDLVHLHHWGGLSGDLVRRLTKRLPVVVTLHDAFASCPRYFRVPLAGCACPRSRPTDDCVRCIRPLIGQRGPGDLRERLQERWQDFRAELCAATQVVAPSRYQRDALSAALELDGAGWRVVPHGLCQALAPAGGERAGGPLTVLSFGNRARVKGTLDLVRGAAALPRGSLRLVLLGAEVEGGVDAELRRAAGGLELAIEGRYGPELLAERAAGADLAAFPSRAAESYGLVVEEALALGLPVWVSDRGALPEVLADAAGRGPLPGGVVPAEDPAAWTRTLQRLVERPDRLHDARALVPDRLRNVEGAVEQLLQLYAEVRERHPIGRR